MIDQSADCILNGFAHGEFLGLGRVAEDPAQRPGPDRTELDHGSAGPLDPSGSHVPFGQRVVGQVEHDVGVNVPEARVAELDLD